MSHPTEPGHHWARLPGEDWEIIRIVQLDDAVVDVFIDGKFYTRRTPELFAMFEWGPRIIPPNERLRAVPS